jgi:hypothetical protein
VGQSLAKVSLVATAATLLSSLSFRLADQVKSPPSDQVTSPPSDQVKSPPSDSSSVAGSADRHGFFDFFFGIAVVPSCFQAKMHNPYFLR